MEIKTLNINQVEVNKGQLYGLPKNPRFIRDERFAKLKKSIQDAPEMLELRELLVYPLENGKFIIIGGNMRYRACIDLGINEVPCKVIPLETPVQKLREYTIKDNEAFGQNDWDILANEWEQEELEDWGVECLPQDTDWDDLDRLDGEDKEVVKPQVIKVNVPDNYSNNDIKDIKAVLSEALAKFQGCAVV